MQAVTRVAVREARLKEIKSELLNSQKLKVDNDVCPDVEQNKMSMSKTRKNVYRSDAQVTFEFYGHFRCLQVLFSCDQAALQMVFSVRLSVCLSVCPSVRLSHLFDYVPIIVSSWNFQELLPMTKVRSMQKVKVRGQRSRSQRSQPNLTVSGL